MLKPRPWLPAGGRTSRNVDTRKHFLGGAVFASTSTAEVDKHLLLDAIRTFVQQL